MKGLSKIFVLALSFAALFLAMPMISEAQTGFDVSVSHNEITVNNTEIGAVDVVIRNNQLVSDTFQISIWPSTTWSGITPDLEKDKVTIGAGNNASVKLYFSVSSNAEEVVSTFLMSVKSGNTDDSSSSSINVRTKRKTLVYISDFAIDKTSISPGSCILIRPSITNDGFEAGTYRLQTSITKGNSVVNRFEDDVFEIGSKSIKTLEKTYCFENYTEAGTYSVEITLRTEINKFMDSRKESLVVNELSDLVFKKSGVYTPFIQMQTITVKNEGNVVETNFNVTESVSEFTANFFHPIDQPTSTYVVNGNTVYVWNVDALAPGQSLEIKYEIRFIIIWVAGIGIAAFVFLAFSYVYRPKIRKGVRFMGEMKKGKETVVLLEIKNSTLKEIKNVIIEDTVSPIATLVERFDTIPPQIRKTAAGTSLIWKIKSLNPLEERVLTYRIKPKVEIIGSMRMPGATMSFDTKKKDRKTVSSRSIEIK